MPKRGKLWRLGCLIAGGLIGAASMSFGATVGNWVSTTPTGSDPNLVEFSTGGTQKVRIYVCTPIIARVSFDPAGTFTSTHDVLKMKDVNRAWPAVAGLSVGDSGTYVAIKTSAMIIHVQKAPFRISFYKADETKLVADSLAMNSAGYSASSPTFCFTQGADEHYFGWGLAYEQYRSGYHKMDNKGQTYSYRRSTSTYMYSTAGYAVWPLFAEPRPNTESAGSISNPTTGVGFDLTGSSAKYWQNNMTQSGFNDGIMEYASYYFFLGDWKTAMSAYTSVSGRPPRLGKKWYGLMRDMYFQAGQTLQTVHNWATMFRSNRFNMDWVRFDDFFDWTNMAYSPTSSATCWNVGLLPIVKYYRDTCHFWVGGMSVGWGFNGCCNSGCRSKVVADSAHARTAVNNGFDWMWYDAMNYHSRCDADSQWNIWVKAHYGDETKVMISRGWQALSSQAWPGNHMGDYLNSVYVYAVFPSQLQEALVGYAWSHCDLGENYDFGYIGYTFRPMATIHMAGAAGGTSTNFQECGNVGNYPADLKRVMCKWDNLRYRFIPFMFTYGMLAHETGIPPTRALVCQDGGENTAFAYTDQAMYEAYLGNELIWSPYYYDLPGDVNSNARHNIYLPNFKQADGSNGVWYNYFKGGASIAGGTTIASYPVGTVRDSMTLPTFVKSGSIIPLMDTLQYIGERAESLITVQVWPTNGQAVAQNGSFTLYEDEGTATYNPYNLDNVYATAPSKTTLSFEYDPTTNPGPKTTVHLGGFAGSKYCPQNKRVWRVEMYYPGNVTAAYINATPLSQITLAQYAAGNIGYYYSGSVAYINAGDGSTGGGSIANGFGVSVNLPASVKGSQIVPQKSNISVIRHVGAVEIRVPFSGIHTVQILDPLGRVVAERSGNQISNYMITINHHTPMMYIVRVAAQGSTIIKKLML